MANNSSKSYISEQASSLFGLCTESIGKTQARQEFLPMVDDLKKHPRMIEITDRDNPVAVLLSYEHYAALVGRLSKLVKKPTRRKVDLRNSGVIIGDLKKASKEIAQEFLKSLDRGAEGL